MECFRQLFRCLKEPFRRNGDSQERVIEIGPPTNFRKEELPIHFSDAESVLSQSQNRITRPILTSMPQHVHSSAQPRSHHGQEQNDNRNGGTSAITKMESLESCAGSRYRSVATRFRNRMKLAHWFKPIPVADSDTEAMDRDSVSIAVSKE